MAQAFPGRSIFIWVPIVIKSSIASIQAGLTEAAASPEGLDLPYLNLNPPGSCGAPKTGLPAIISFMNLVMGSISRDLNLTFSASSSFLSFSANLVIKSHPDIFILSVCFRIFGAFKHIPSPITNRTPPLILASSIFLTLP